MKSLMFLSQFFRDIRSQKLRTFLTIFGITWGTIAVVLLLGFGVGLDVNDDSGLLFERSLDFEGERLVNAAVERHAFIRVLAASNGQPQRTTQQHRPQ